MKEINISLKESHEKTIKPMKITIQDLETEIEIMKKI